MDSECMSPLSHASQGRVLPAEYSGTPSEAEALLDPKFQPVQYIRVDHEGIKIKGPALKVD